MGNLKINNLFNLIQMAQELVSSIVTYLLNYWEIKTVKEFKFHQLMEKDHVLAFRLDINPI
jgi:hypothetical protein